MAGLDLKSAMKLEFSEVEPCQKKADYTVPVEAVKEELNSVIREFRGFAQIPGFRKGKAPAALIKNRFLPQIKEELARRFYTTAFQKVQEDDSIQIVSYRTPDEDKVDVKLDAEFTFSIEFDVAPDFTLPEYKGLKIDAPPVEVAEEALNERMDYYRNMYAEYKNIEEPAQKEDMLKVTYTSDFELPEDASVGLKRQVETEEGWIWLNEPETIPGCVEALLGAEKGKEYDLKAEYAEDYREEALAGKTVNYKVNVVDVQRRMPLESDDELAKRMNLESIDALKEQLESGLKSEAETQQRTALREQITEELLGKIDEFPIPPMVLQSETQKELRALANQAVKSEEDAEKFKEEQDQHMAEAKEAATKKMRRFFIMSKIAKEEGISVSAEEFDQHLQGMSRYFGYKEADLRKMLANSGGQDDIQADMLVAKVTDFLVDNAELSEKESAKKETKAKTTKKKTTKKADDKKED